LAASLYSARELDTKTASGRHLHDAALSAAHKTFRQPITLMGNVFSDVNYNKFSGRLFLT